MYRKHIIEEISHKTVIVLDRGPKFAQDARTDLPVHLHENTKTPAELVGHFHKSLWNASIEAVIEFHRIVNDLFPCGTKQLRVIASDFISRAVTRSWANDKELIDYEELIDALAACVAPDPQADASSCSVLPGIAMALESLSELTALQKEVIRTAPRRDVDVVRKRRQTSSSTFKKPGTFQEKREYQGIVKRFPSIRSLLEDGELLDEQEEYQLWLNRGNIVVLTSFDDEKEFENIAADLVEKVKVQNRMGLLDENQLWINQLYCYVLNISPDISEEKDAHPEHQGIKPTIQSHQVKCTLFNCKAGDELMSVMIRILLDIYDLVSTTVCNIPMKEEAQSGIPIGYNVELVHRRAAHSQLGEYGLLKQLKHPQDYGKYETVRLKWISQSTKLKSEMFPLFLGSCPATVTHLNSRQAVCLSGYIVNSGKNIMLEAENPPKEMEPNLYGKLISHFITHDEASGVILMQMVAFGPKAAIYGQLRKPIEFDKQHLNYLIFSQFMKSMSVSPVPIDTDAEQKSYDEHFDLAKAITHYFPTSLKDTFVFNIPEKFEPLLSLIAKKELSQEEFKQCQQVLVVFAGSKVKNETYPRKALGCNLLSKGCKKDIIYRVAVEELYNYMRNFVNNSDRHLELFNTLAKLINVDEVTPKELEPVPVVVAESTVKVELKDVQSEDLMKEVEHREGLPAVTKKSMKEVEHREGPPAVAKKSKNIPEEFLWKRDGDQPAQLYPNLKPATEGGAPGAKERGPRFTKGVTGPPLMTRKRKALIGETPEEQETPQPTTSTESSSKEPKPTTSTESPEGSGEPKRKRGRPAGSRGRGRGRGAAHSLSNPKVAPRGNLTGKEPTPGNPTMGKRPYRRLAKNPGS